MNAMLKNLLVKDSLAKLLAGENITVIHDNVSWPYFDVKNRVLGLPIWEVDEFTHNMLTGHEVGHAVETPHEWYKVLNPTEGGMSDLKTALNIVEDARIERLIMNRYPGLRKDFRKAYQGYFFPKLWKDMIDKQAGGDINKLSIADRVNLHFKMEISGEQDIGIKFNKAEQNLVDRIHVAETFAEVVTLARELLAMQQLDNRITLGDDLMGDGDMEVEIEIDEDALTDEQREQLKKALKEGKKGSKKKGGTTVKVNLNEDSELKELFDEAEAGEDGDGEGDDEGQGKGKGKGQKGDEESDEDGEGEGSGDGEGDEDGEGSGDGEGDGDDDSGKQGSEAGDQGGGKKGGVGGGDKPTKLKIRIKKGDDTGLGETERAFQNQQIQNAATGIINCKLGNVNWDRVIVPYTSLFASAKGKYERTDSYRKWAQEQKPLVNFLVNDFNRKKAAKQYEYKRTDKTGLLNLDKLHAHSYSRDMFKSQTVLPGAKKHCFMMFIDCSGSMSQTITGAIKQMLSLMQFCDAIRIPYRVFGFTSRSGLNVPQSALYKNRDPNFALVGPEGDLVLYEFFTEKMSRIEKDHMIDLLWEQYARRGMVNGWPISMGGTPMMDSIFYAIDKLPELMKNTGSQIAHVIYLTDGEDNGRSRVYFAKNPYGEAFVHDHGKVYEFTPTAGGDVSFFRDVLAQRYGAELINFYIQGGSKLARDNNPRGWTEQYFIGDQLLDSQVSYGPKASSIEGQSMDLGSFVRAQTNAFKKNREYRFILSNFVDKISKSAIDKKGRRR